MRRRTKSQPVFRFSFWKREGELLFAELADLKKAFLESGLSEDDLKRKLGAGYSEFQEALDGKRLEKWSASHIDWGLSPPGIPVEAHSWPPNVKK